MSHHVTITRTRTARVSHAGREGITVGLIREFLADCDAVEIPDDARVHLRDDLAGEGANRRGHIEASHREPQAAS